MLDILFLVWINSLMWTQPKNVGANILLVLHSQDWLIIPSYLHVHYFQNCVQKVYQWPGQYEWLCPLPAGAGSSLWRGHHQTPARLQKVRYSTFFLLIKMVNCNENEYICIRKTNMSIKFTVYFQHYSIKSLPRKYFSVTKYCCSFSDVHVCFF